MHILAPQCQPNDDYDVTHQSLTAGSANRSRAACRSNSLPFKSLTLFHQNISLTLCCSHNFGHFMLCLMLGSDTTLDIYSKFVFASSRSAKSRVS